MKTEKKEETQFRKLNQSEAIKLFNSLCYEVWTNSLIPNSFRDKKISGLQGEYIQKIANDIIKWDFKDPLICTILSVQNGIGKTHLAVCLLREYIKRKVIENKEKNELIYLNIINNKDLYNWGDLLLPSPVCFVKEQKLLLEIRETYISKFVSEIDIIEKYSRYPVLVIDDIFSSNESGDKEFARRTLLNILDERTDNLSKPTILTGNFNLDEIADIDTRLSSRINNSMLFEIKTMLVDFRKR